jgi:hypothetical protein
VQRAPGIPHALYFWGEYFLHNSGASRCENVGVCLELERRHCEEPCDEAIHSCFLVALWIASLTLAMTA